MYFYVASTTYEYRVLMQKDFNRGRADAYEEKTTVYVLVRRMTSLIGSELARISRKLDRVEKVTYTVAFSSHKISHELRYPWPIAGLLGCVLYLF